MNFPMQFIAAGTDFSGEDRQVPAPYLRKRFTLEKKPEKAELLLCGLGFYELYVNGQRVTKGALAPYISNPDDLIYYDAYDLSAHLTQGENVLGLCLGNGFQNAFEGWWGFDEAPWRGAPQAALRLEIDGAPFLESDESFTRADSPILFDEMRCGEYYDARRELPGWCAPGYDDSGWRPAVRVPAPRGEPRLCEAEPIAVTEEIGPVSVTDLGDGYLYDFGVNCAGVSRLKVRGAAGQEIRLWHGELLTDGCLDISNISGEEYGQMNLYICKDGPQEWAPSFAWHGFRYVFVKGLTPEQAVPEALTYLVMNSDLQERGGFCCSDETVNALQEMTRRSDRANFYYFPTDCPHREKNGWTGDAALSAEHMLLNLSAERSFREWLRNVRKAQRDNGSFPGLVPCAGKRWAVDTERAYAGPAWDCVLTWLPYYVYLYRGDKEILKENAHAILRYLEYLSTRVRGDGLIDYGLGDWCPAGHQYSAYQSPVRFTDTITSMDICEKAAYIFGALALPEHRAFALSLYQRLRTSARERLLDLSTMTAEGCCQTSQAMAIYYNLFEPAEKPEALRVLLRLIEQAEGHFTGVGVLGARALFHVLAEFGQVDLALRMIARPEFPSYGWWVAQGATSLWEQFNTEDQYSLNHHFWGDISHFFIRHLAGICYNPHRRGGEADVCPKFAASLNFAEGWHAAPEGEVRVRWQREEGGISLEVAMPEGLKGQIRLPLGYAFEDGTAVKAAASGQYRVRALDK